MSSWTSGYTLVELERTQERYGLHFLTSALDSPSIDCYRPLAFTILSPCSESKKEPATIMLISTSRITDWSDLQNLVAALFREMGYEALTTQKVNLSGRGKKEVDVYIKDPRASVNQILLIECKFWETSVRQEIVHSFYTVMAGAGANTGFIISKAGFQRGAYEAARNTNIHLLTWEEFQHKFGRQWYLHRVTAIAELISKVHMIDSLYLDQYSLIPIHNLMFFEATGHTNMLLDILGDLRIAEFAWIARPETYDAQPKPVPVYPGFPGATLDKYNLWELKLNDTRDFFDWITVFTRLQIDRFEKLRMLAHDQFDGLSDGGAAAMERSLQFTVEELPIRTFKSALGDKLYKFLVGKRLSLKD